MILLFVKTISKLLIFNIVHFYILYIIQNKKKNTNYIMIYNPEKLLGIYGSQFVLNIPRYKK